MAPECDPAQMGALDEAHKRFEPFAGTFKAKVTLWMGSGEPDVSTGIMTNTLDLGGRYLHQVYQGDRADGPFGNFEGRGYWGFNSVTRKYEGFWIDSVSPFMQHEVGDVDESGKIWTMIGEFPDPQSGHTITKRSVITLKDADHNAIQMYMTGSEGKESKVMEITYERA